MTTATRDVTKLPADQHDHDSLAKYHEVEPHPNLPTRKPVAKGQLLIGGKWRDASDGATMPTTDPTTEQVITHVAKATPDDARAAVAAASKAFEEGPWGRMHHEQRAKVLFKIADLMDERAADFALREAMDMGMPFRDFRDHHHAALLRLVPLLWRSGHAAPWGAATEPVV